MKRFINQKNGAKTFFPEDPILIRIYTGNNGIDYKSVEKSFHKILVGADHEKSKGRRTGQEWFLTSLKLLDTIAEDKELKIGSPLEEYDDED